MKNILVVGGGTAGWFTALMVKQYHPNINVTVVESDEIGILGAGEGCTPHLVDIINSVLGINISQLISETGATIKTGIRFTNWNGDGEDYFHGFAADSELSQIANFNVLSTSLEKYGNIENIDFVDKLSKNKKIPFLYSNTSTFFHENKINFYRQLAAHAIHFNARELAKFLSKEAQKKGINRIEGKVTEIINDENENIIGIRLNTVENIIQTDFVFDCTGFARVFIGKHFKTEWESYSKYLPMNTAIPFFIEHDNDVAPETESIAMKYGWIWKIPIKDRYGCGYVFDSSYINEEEALKEAEDYFQRKLTVPKTFKFEAGCYKKCLVKNCLAVGLSQGFIEPLEATSLWVSLSSTLNKFLKNDGLMNNTESFRKIFNEKVYKVNSDTKNFIYLHYLTKRDDSPFWKEFRDKHPMIEEVNDDLEVTKSWPQLSMSELLNNSSFTYLSYFKVGYGLKLITSENILTNYRKHNLGFNENLLEWCIQKQDRLLSACETHKNFIEYLSS